MKAILSPLFTLKLILSNIFTPSIVLESSSRVKISLPTSLSIANPTKGYLLVEGAISSSVIFSSNFLREVACLDLEALALKRVTKA